MLKNKLFPIVLFTVLWILSACQPTLLKKPTAKSEPDSVLFYQKKDLHDPFLDALLLKPHDQVVLTQTVLPPPKPAPKFKSIPGFRVQIFASGDSLAAARQMENVAALVNDSCLIVKDKGLFKVQVGNFPKRVSADSLKSFLKTHGFKGAWVVTTTITVPIVKQSLSTSTPPDSVSRQPAPPAPAHLKSPFRIQVFATGDQSKARAIVTRLKQTFNLPCSFEQQGTLFKIFIDGFNTRAQAEAVLQKVKSSGYKDAWIVHQ